MGSVLKSAWGSVLYLILKERGLRIDEFSFGFVIAGQVEKKIAVDAVGVEELVRQFIIFLLLSRDYWTWWKRVS